MLDILKKTYWSKSEAFLVPLIGLSKSQKFPFSSYLFWEEYSIEDYNLILKFKYTDYEDFHKYCKDVIFPSLDKEIFISESFDYEDYSIFILDISEWGKDVEMFLKGKYSKLSSEAKERIVDYHSFFVKGSYKKPFHISIALNPTKKFSELEGMTAIEYVADHYKLDLNDLKDIGELASIYDKKEETLDEERSSHT